MSRDCVHHVADDDLNLLLCLAQPMWHAIFANIETAVSDRAVGSPFRYPLGTGADYQTDQLCGGEPQVMESASCTGVLGVGLMAPYVSIDGENDCRDAETIGLETLIHDCKQAAPEGTRFEYSAADSELLGLILTLAVRMPLACYLDERIWRRIGTEANATWTIDASDHEVPFCCFNAILRDYARFARLLAFDGAWNGKQLIPRQWLVDATSVNESDPQLAPANLQGSLGMAIKHGSSREQGECLACLGRTASAFS